MLRQGLALALGVGLLVGMAGNADAAKRKKAPSNTVTVSGCTKWVPPFCMMLSGGGKTFSLVGALPAVPSNVGVTAIGVQEGVVGPCFAPTLKVVKWWRNRLRCPKT